MHVIAQGKGRGHFMYTIRLRESALEVDLGVKFPWHTGELNMRGQCTRPCAQAAELHPHLVAHKCAVCCFSQEVPTQGQHHSTLSSFTSCERRSWLTSCCRAHSPSQNHCVLLWKAKDMWESTPRGQVQSFPFFSFLFVNISCSRDDNDDQGEVHPTVAVVVSCRYVEATCLHAVCHGPQVGGQTICDYRTLVCCIAQLPDSYYENSFQNLLQSLFFFPSYFHWCGVSVGTVFDWLFVSPAVQHCSCKS